MANVYNVKGPEFRFRGFCTGMWVDCDVDLDQHESVAAAAVTAATAAAFLPMGLPGLALAALIGSYAGEIVENAARTV